jgi:hypothetical protein
MGRRKGTTVCCHPERTCYARGMCKECYRKSRPDRKGPAKCCEGRKEYAKGLCERCYSAERREKHPDKMKEYSRTWRTKNTEEARRRSKACLEKNPERTKNWRLRNVEKIRASRHRRRARLRDGRSPGVSAETFLRKCEESDWRCWYCMKKCDKLQREHVVPVARGGLDSPENVVPACSCCNFSKHDKLLSEWIGVRLDLLK